MNLNYSITPKCKPKLDFQIYSKKKHLTKNNLWTENFEFLGTKFENFPPKFTYIIQESLKFNLRNYFTEIKILNAITNTQSIYRKYNSSLKSTLDKTNDFPARAGRAWPFPFLWAGCYQ